MRLIRTCFGRLFVGLALATCAYAWPNSYAYRRTFTVQSGQVPSTQSNFSMLIAGTFDGSGGTPDLRTVAHGGKVAGVCNQTTIVVSVGCDIKFTSDAAGSTTLAFEWETYNATTGALNVWVKVPSIANGTVIYLWYGNAGVSTFQGNVNGTWDGNYLGAWHLKDGSTLSVADSSGAAPAATNNGATAVAGKIDGGAGFNGSSQYITLGTTGLDIAPPLTVTLWFNYTTADASARRLFMKDGRYTAWLTSTTLNFGVFAATNATWTYGANLVSGTWYRVSFVADATNVTIYVNGVQKAQAAYGTLTQTAGNVLDLGRYSGSGSQYFAGSEDEVRISNIARSADWLTTEYNNQSAPSSFYSIGAEQLAINGAALIIQ